MRALVIVRQGKALYAGISSYTAEQTRQAAAIMRDLGHPCSSISPPQHVQRWIEGGLWLYCPRGDGRHRLRALGSGPSDRQVPEGHSRTPAHQAQPPSALPSHEDKVAQVPSSMRWPGRGQTLAQMALAWVLPARRHLCPHRGP